MREAKLKKLIPALVLIVLTLNALTLILNVHLARSDAGTRLVMTPQTNTYYANQTASGHVFVLNITVINITSLATWQVEIAWNQSLLSFVNMTIPTDNVFAGQSPFVVGPDASTPGKVVYGATLFSGTPFTGTGRLCQLALNITADPDQTATCNISFSRVRPPPPNTAQTFLLDENSNDIFFNAEDGNFTYVGLTSPPVQIAELSILPENNTFRGNETPIGSTFTVNVTVTNVTKFATWQVGIMWNESLLSYVNVTVPSSNVFAGQNTTSSPPDTSIPGKVVFGSSLNGGSPFNGSGILCQLTLNITAQSPIPVSCDTSFFDFAPSNSSSTFLRDNTMSGIPFTVKNATFTYMPPAPPPAGIPRLAILPQSNIFYNNQTTLPHIFIVNITIINVTQLTLWQVGITWNESILSFVNMTIPSDNVFAGQATLVAGPDPSTPGKVVMGAILTPGGIPFNGTGTLCQLALNTTAYTSLPVSSNISFYGVPPTHPPITFLCNGTYDDMIFQAENSTYRFEKGIWPGSDLYGSTGSGWGLTSSNITSPGPTITVNLNDLANLTLTSADGLPHRFFVDYDGNGTLDPGEPASPVFNSTIDYHFFANVPGTFRYRCYYDPSAMYGIFIVVPPDTVPPAIAILSPENRTYSSSNASLIFTVNESASWMGYSLDGQANVTIFGNMTLSGLVDGVHCVAVFANDAKANMGMSGTVWFSIDTIPPNVTGIDQTPNVTRVMLGDSVSINATVTDGLSGVKQVILSFTNGDGTWMVVNMTNLQGNVWNATIPAFLDSTNVTYTITATDNVNSSITTEEMGFSYQSIVTPEFPSLTVIPLFTMIAVIAALGCAKRQRHRKDQKPASLKQSNHGGSKLESVAESQMPRKAWLRYQQCSFQEA